MNIPRLKVEAHMYSNINIHVCIAKKCARVKVIPHAHEVGR